MTQSESNSLSPFLSSLSDLEKRLAKAADTSAELKLLLKAAVQMTDSQTSEIDVVSVDGRNVWIRAASGALRDAEGRSSPAGEGLHGEVLQKRETRRVPNLQDLASFRQLSDPLRETPYGRQLKSLRAALGSPIWLGNRIIGVLCLARHKDGQEYTEADAVLADYFASRIGTSLAAELGSAAEREFSQRASAVASLLALTEEKVEKIADCERVRQELYQRLVNLGLTIGGVSYTSVREYSTLTRHMRYVKVEPSEEWKHLSVIGRGWHDTKSGGRQAALAKKPYVFDTLSLAEHYEKQFDEVISHVSLPILLDDECALVWSLESKRAGNFTGRRLQDLKEIAQEAETVLRWLGKATLLATAKFEEICNRAKDVKEFLTEAAKVFREIFGVADCAIYLTTSIGDSIELAGQSGDSLEDDQTLETDRWYSIEATDETNKVGNDVDGVVSAADKTNKVDSLTAHVVHSRKTLRIDNLGNPKCFPSPALRRLWRGAQVTNSKKLRGFLGVPIKGANKVLGVLRFSTRLSEQPFSIEEVRFAERLAERLGLAIDRVCFLRQMQVASQLADVRPLESVVKTAELFCKRAVELLPVPCVYVRLKDENGLRMIAWHGTEPDAVPINRRMDDGLSSRVAKGHRVVTINDPDSEQPWADIHRLSVAHIPDSQKWVKSVACAPLYVGNDDPFGTIVFLSGDCHRFHVGTIPIIEEIARHAAFVLQLVDVQETQAANDRAATCCSTDLMSNPQHVSVESVAASVARAFTIRIPEASTSIWLYNESKTELKCVAVEPSALSREPNQIQRLLLSARLDLRVLRKTGLINPELPFWLAGNQLNELSQLIHGEDISETTRKWADGVGQIGVSPIRLDNDFLGFIFCYIEKTLEYSVTSKRKEAFDQLARTAVLVFGTARFLERRRKEANVATPLAMIGALLDAILHHLVQPLHNMRVILPNARRLAIGNERLIGKIQDIAQQIGRMEQNVTDLKAFATGRGARNTQLFDLAITMQKIADRTRWQWPKVQVIPEIPLTPMHVPGVEPILEAGLSMVVQNAIDAMPGGGQLTVTLEQLDGNAVATFADTGCGMPKAILNAAVDPGFTTKHKGGGLGLAVARAACLWHGGQLTVDSVEGQGTTVKFLIPLKEPAR